MNAAVDFLRHHGELCRAVRNKHYEVTPAGILFPKIPGKPIVGGVFEHWLNGEDHRVDENTFALTGVDVFFTTGITAGSYYLAPYSNNTAPTNALTAATFPGTQGEYTNYAETARVPWVKDGYANNQMATNATTKAVFTATSPGGTVYGIGMTNTPTKSATSGTLIACAAFGAARVLQTTDTLTVQYTLTLTTS